MPPALANPAPAASLSTVRRPILARPVVLVPIPASLRWLHDRSTPRARDVGLEKAYRLERARAIRGAVRTITPPLWRRGGVAPRAPYFGNRRRTARAAGSAGPAYRRRRRSCAAYARR